MENNDILKFSEQIANKKEQKPTAGSSQAKASVKVSDKIKSANKAAGLKSTLHIKDDIYMTSFGKGNDAIVEYRIKPEEEYKIYELARDNIEAISADKIGIRFSGRRAKTNEELLAHNPINLIDDEENVATDILQLRKALEKRFFEDYEKKDNIHIQIAYNILDIEKIIAVYSNSICLSIDNIAGDKLENRKDIMDNFNSNAYEKHLHGEKRYDKGAILDEIIKSGRMGYFGFERDVDKLYVARLLDILSDIRLYCTHSSADDDKSVYAEFGTKGKQEALSKATRNFLTKRFEKIENEFVKTNAVNLMILEEQFEGDDISRIAQDYHDFIVFKAHKNMGFSIKRIREEALLTETLSYFKAQRFDTIRSKLYKLMDFSIYSYFNERPLEAMDIVAALRQATDDEQKDKVYSELADKVTKRFSEDFAYYSERIMKYVKMRDSDKQTFINSVNISTGRIYENTISAFSKKILVMTAFLDAKEINELLTLLINKIDVITSFIKTAKQLGVEIRFTKKYDFFNNLYDDNKKGAVKSVVDELNLIKSIARMEKPDAKSNSAMWHDAAVILGTKYDQEAVKELFVNNHKLRNFTINSVCQSNRFVYAIKNCKPGEVKKLVSNYKLVKFVLGRMSDDLLKRYSRACGFGAKGKRKELISKLTNEICSVKFEMIESVVIDSKRYNEKEKQRKLAIIGLYLTVAYQIVKNLVNINSRYVMAFHCVERDVFLLYTSYYGYPVKEFDKKFNVKLNHLDLINRLIEAVDKNEKSHGGAGYLLKDKDYLARIKKLVNKANRLSYTYSYKNSVNQKVEWTTISPVELCRNNVCHLSVARNCAKYLRDIDKIESYFSLYHFILQKLVIESYIQLLNKKLKQVKDEQVVKRLNANLKTAYGYDKALKTFKGYTRELLKLCMSPCAYNKPRYLNLTVQVLFDKNEEKK